MTVSRLLAFYGDDQTGSTDVMEALELGGVSTVLFTAIPTADQAAQFANRKALGIAGTSRSETPAWMDEHLPAIFTWLRDQQPKICHYKICSTFDSSPEVGSIGRALDIGADIFGQQSTPLLVGAPELKRYTAFGNLFADYRGAHYRIDRHPVMSRHPVTPMDEADLRRHLSRQTAKTIGLIDVAQLKRGISDEDADAVFDQYPVVILDVLDTETQRLAGKHLWRRRDRSPFVVGSSGVEYALLQSGSVAPSLAAARTFARPGSRGPIAVVSGSCSPITARQIRHAEANGFVGIALAAAALVGDRQDAEIARAVTTGSNALSTGASPLLYTALGSEALDGELSGQGHVLGRSLGRILDGLVRKHRLARAIVAGGDTSSHAIRELGIYALECLMPLAASPGSPLCKAHRTDRGSIEIAFKGGQVGGDDYFEVVRDL